MLLSLKCLFSLLISLKVQSTISMVRNVDLSKDDFQPVIEREASSAVDTNYNEDYKYQAKEKQFDASAYAKASGQQFYSSKQRRQQNYQSDYEANKKYDYDIPNDDEEEIYVFLDKGLPRYMPMNHNNRPKIIHGDFNINGQHMPGNQLSPLLNAQIIGWITAQKLDFNQHEYDSRRSIQSEVNINDEDMQGNQRGWTNEQQQDFNRYEYDRKQIIQTDGNENSQNFNQFQNDDWSEEQQQGGDGSRRNFQKRHNCLKDIILGPASRHYGSSEGYDYNDEMSGIHAGRERKDCVENDRKGFPKLGNTNGANGGRMQPMCQEHEQKLPDDCIGKHSEIQIVTKDVDDVEENSVKHGVLKDGNDIILGSALPPGIATERKPSVNKSKIAENDQEDKGFGAVVAGDGISIRLRPEKGEIHTSEMNEENGRSMPEKPSEVSKNLLEKKEHQQKILLENSEQLDDNGNEIADVHQLNAKRMPEKPGISEISNTTNKENKQKTETAIPSDHLGNDERDEAQVVRREITANPADLKESKIGREKLSKNKHADDANEQPNKLAVPPQESSPPKDKPLIESSVHNIKIRTPDRAHKKLRKPTPNPSIDNYDFLMKEPSQSLPSEEMLLINSPMETGALIPNTPRKLVDSANEHIFTPNGININAKTINDDFNIAFQKDTAKRAIKAAFESGQNMEFGNDLNPSGDRFHTYVTKLDGSAPKLKAQHESTHMEPIAFESFLQKEGSNKKHKTPKYLERRVSKRKRSPSKARRIRNQYTTTTTTTEPPILTATEQRIEPKLQLSLQNQQKNTNKRPKKKMFPLRPVKRSKALSKDESLSWLLQPQETMQTLILELDDEGVNVTSNNEPTPKQQEDSEVLGSERSFNEDYDETTACQFANLDDDEEDYFDQDPNRLELNSAEYLNSQHEITEKCEHDNVVPQEGDYQLNRIAGALTPAPLRQSDCDEGFVTK